MAEGSWDRSMDRPTDLDAALRESTGTGHGERRWIRSGMCKEREKGLDVENISPLTTTTTKTKTLPPRRYRLAPRAGGAKGGYCHAEGCTPTCHLQRPETRRRRDDLDSKQARERESSARRRDGQIRGQIDPCTSSRERIKGASRMNEWSTRLILPDG